MAAFKPQKGKATPREVLDQCKHVYETTRTSFRKLQDRFGVDKSVLSTVARREGWKVPSVMVKNLAQQVEDTILVAGLSSTVSRGQPPPVVPPEPPPRPAPRPGVKSLGRPRKHAVGVIDADRLTEEQRRLKTAREMYEAGGWSLKKLGEKFGFTSGKMSYVAKCEGWRAPPPRIPSAIPDVASTQSADQPGEPASDNPRPKVSLLGEARRDVRTADIIDFPVSPPAPPKKAAEMQLLPPPSSDDKQQLRIALGAIRALMSVQQVQQLERHEQLLRNYAHLIEVYLEPGRFVNTDGLAPDDAANKIVAAQHVALRMLLPSDRDTLAGAIKTLTDSLRVTMKLKRDVAGLDRVKGGSAAASFPAALRAPDGSDLDEMPGMNALLDINAMGTEQLRAVQQAMEMLQTHHRRQQEPPKPPPPDSIEDLRGPPIQVVKEPDEDELPPR